MFTKQHYKVIAKIVRETTYNDGEDFCCLRGDLIAKLADFFGRDNPLFDKAEFYQACTEGHER